MKIKCLPLLVLLVLFSCNDSDKEKTVDVFISSGKLQCQDNAIPIDTTTSYLTNAGIVISNQSCGIINAGYPTVCGGETGEIHIYTIPKDEINSAENIGFTKVSTLEDGYQSVDCALFITRL